MSDSGDFRPTASADLFFPRSMNVEKPHICVCICTYKRPQLLKRLLNELRDQETKGLFSYSVTVADNDVLESARSVVLAFEADSSVPIRYCVEEQQNIALTRNKAIDNAEGDFIAFIDDDEFPIKSWLLLLYEACGKHDVDGVLGPVKRHFDEQPPKWLLRSNFYERSTYPTGLVIDWRKGRTGNVLLRKRVFSGVSQPFRPEFRTGEDQDFFQRMIEEGYVFVWCNEAIAYEAVPQVRWKRSFMLKRALLRGAMEPKTAGFGIRGIAMSLIAVPVYCVALPFSLFCGQHRFMTLLVSLCDHLGKLLALLGVHLIKDQYVTD